MVATTPPDQVVTALVRELSDTVEGQVAYCVAEADSLAVVAMWPEHGGNLTPGNLTPGDLTHEVACAEVAGGGTLHVAEPRRWTVREHTALRQTADWLGVVVRLEQLRGERERAEARARRLRSEVTAGRARLAKVRELERRRLVQAVTMTTLRDLAAVRGRLRGLCETPRTGEALSQELEVVRDALDDLLDDFRTVVRGVYPAMLPDRGPRAALEELAATLPRPVRFDGDLARRADWQVESGLYHAVAATLNVLTGAESSAEPVTVELSGDHVPRVRVGASTGLSAEDLRAALEHDAERIAVIGGQMECTVTDGGPEMTGTGKTGAEKTGTAEIWIRAARRPEPADAEVVSPRFERSALYRQVRDLVRQGQAAAGEDGPYRSRWDAVAERLTQPARLAVVRDSSTSTPDVAHAVALGVTVVEVSGPADWALARDLLAEDEPHSSVDAVLCLVTPTSAFQTTLRYARQRVELSESGSLAELAGKLVTWGPVIAARRAVVAIRELMSELPPDDPLRWSIEQIGAEAHEFAELDLLDELGRGESRLLRGGGPTAAADVTRLLGAQGKDPRTRLGLIAAAGVDEVHAAAQDAVRRWRAHAERPTTGARDRAACEVLVRTAEGLLSKAWNP
nr:diguanylate cyclase/phosphodiesterase (GGDEF & EAL domains) with PAS/PAC sensor(s) [Kibdelosporangium sp. MJ126-NF4]